MKTCRNELSRRDLLATGLSVAAASFMASPWRSLFAAGASRGFKIGACEWNLGKTDPSSFDLAKQIGLDGLQITMGSQANDLFLRKTDIQKAYLDAAKRTGLEIGSIALGETCFVPLKNDPLAAQWLSDSIDVAKAMGLPIVMPGCFAKGDLDMANTKEIDYLVGALKSVAPKAEKAGIIIGLESYLSAEDNLTILDRVGSPALKVYYDVGNSTDKGRDVLKEIPLLGKRICEFHFKDGDFVLGQGRIDFRKVRKAIDQIGYTGWLFIEAAAPHGVLKDYADNYRYLRGIFPERG